MQAGKVSVSTGWAIQVFRGVGCAGMSTTSQTHGGGGAPRGVGMGWNTEEHVKQAQVTGFFDGVKCDRGCASPETQSSLSER